MTEAPSIRDEVEARDAAKQEAAAVPAPPGQLDPTVLVRAALDEQLAEVWPALPKSVTPERFADVVLHAVHSNRELVQCFETPEGQRSVFLAAAKAALAGLEPNTVTDDCWLEPVKVRASRRKMRWECRLQLGYRGRRKLMRNDPDVLRVFAEVVRDGDEFWPTPFDREPFHHPFDKRNRDGALKFAYACVVYRDASHPDQPGRIEATPVLWRQDIEWHRSFSPSYNADVLAMEHNANYRPRSAWFTHETDMWLKTALVELSKVADLSASTVLHLLADGARLEVEGDQIVAAPFDADDIWAEPVDTVSVEVDPGSAPEPGGAGGPDPVPPTIEGGDS